MLSKTLFVPLQRNYIMKKHSVKEEKLNSMIKKRKAYTAPSTEEIMLSLSPLLIGVSGKSGNTSDGTGIEDAGDDDGSATPAANEYGWEMWDDSLEDSQT